jgi:uncharacterized SAM-binding protein YcdF (DUF218 family)
LLLYLAADICLPWPARFLIDQQPPRKADAILVLAGDWTGARVLKAVELLGEGYAPVAYLSGPTDLYGRNEGELGLEYAVSKGAQAARFRIIHEPSSSTREEARVLWPHLQQQGIRHFLVVTSDFHTRRAARSYRRVVRDAEFTMVASPGPNFDPKSWWKHREGRKVVFYEWTKTVADWLGL